MVAGDMRSAPVGIPFLCILHIVAAGIKTLVTLILVILMH